MELSMRRCSISKAVTDLMDSFAENANPKQIIVKSVNTFAVWQIHFTIPCFFEQ